jgi:hypothetical protein
MRRTRHDPYARSNQFAYVVLRDMQHQVIECQRLDSATDLRGAMEEAVKRLAADGWRAEGRADYGFVFIRREDERRLLSITERDPYSTGRNHSTHSSEATGSISHPSGGR